MAVGVADSPIAGRPAAARRVLLAATLLCAICGFAYELVIVALGTVLFGSSTEQTALVLGTFVAAMGLGSWLGGRVADRHAITAFVAVECTVALLGGLSALGLFAAYAWLDLYDPAVRTASVVLGALVGAEIPLLIKIVGRFTRDEAGRTVGAFLAADYAGAFAVGLAFPVVVLPALGQVQAALVFGAVNAVGGAIVLFLMRRGLSAAPRRCLWAAVVAVLATLGVVSMGAGRLEASARQALYDDPLVHHEASRVQDIALTRSLDGRDLRLFLNGDLQFSSRDEHRYHESLVHPAMAGPHRRVLVLGGGDGLALREVLRYDGVERATLVELDPAVIRLARERDELRALNRGALHDPRTEVVAADAFSWVRAGSERFDVVIVDFPDPDSDGLAKLYSLELFEMIRRRAMSPGGRLVIQAGSPYFARDAFWCIDTTLQAAGFGTTPYHVDVPSFGDWGFVLATEGRRPALRLRSPRELRFLDEATLAAARAFPADVAKRPTRISTLGRPAIVAYGRRGWRDE